MHHYGEGNGWTPQDGTRKLHVFISIINVIPDSGWVGYTTAPDVSLPLQGSSSKDSCKSTQNLDRCKSTQNPLHGRYFLCDDKTCRSWNVNSCAILQHVSHRHLHHGAARARVETYHSLTHFSTTRVIDPSTSVSTETHSQGPLATYIIIFFFHNPWNVKKTMILLSLLQSMKCPSGSILMWMVQHRKNMSEESWKAINGYPDTL